MAKVKGTVSKAGKGKYSYFLMLDGNDFYYNTKFEPKCGEGDVVGIEFDKKGDTRGQIKRVQVLEDNSGGYQKSNSESGGDDFSGGGSSNKGGGGNAGGARQDSIICQHSQEMAISAAALIIANEGYALKGKPDDKRVQIEGLIDELTVKFFQQAENPRTDAAFKDAAGIEDDASDDEDDSENEWSDDDDWS